MTRKLATPPVIRALPIPRWRALDRTGLAHAFTSRTGPAVCGQRNAEERYDHPRRSKCAVCLAALS